MEVLKILAIIFLMSATIETIVELVFADLFNNIGVLTPYKWAQKYIAIAVAILGAFIYQFDLFYLLGQFVEMENPVAITSFGMVLTGGAIGLGAARLHDLVEKYFVKPK